MRASLVLLALVSVASSAAPPAASERLVTRTAALTREVTRTRYLHEGDSPAGARILADATGALSVDADCSGWVFSQLEQLGDPRYTQPLLALEAAQATEQRLGYPRAYLFWRTFAKPPRHGPYARVTRLEDARPGDLIAWCLNGWCDAPQPARLRGDTGHVLIVAAPSVRLDARHAFVLALDASSIPHFTCDAMLATLPPGSRAGAASQDETCRAFPDVRDTQRPRGGVGAGWVLFGTDRHGAPVTFQFGPGAHVHPGPGETARLAIARLR